MENIRLWLIKPFPFPIPSPCFHQEKHGHVVCREIISTACLDPQYGDTGSSIPGLTTECSQRRRSSLCSERSTRFCQSWWKLASCQPTCLILLQSLRKRVCSRIQGIGTRRLIICSKKMALGRMVNSIVISFTLTSLKRYPNPMHTHIYISSSVSMYAKSYK